MMLYFAPKPYLLDQLKSITLYLLLTFPLSQFIIFNLQSVVETKYNLYFTDIVKRIHEKYEKADNEIVYELKHYTSLNNKVSIITDIEGSIIESSS